MVTSAVSLSAGVIAVVLNSVACAGDTHVWQKVEMELQASERYDNPYTDVTVWVDLAGPGFRRRCYGFWGRRKLRRHTENINAKGKS